MMIDDLNRFFYIPTCLLFFARYLPSTALPIALVRDVKSSATVTGLVVSMIGLGKMIMDLPAGHLIKSLGISVSFTISASLMTGASLLMFVYPGLTIMFVGMGLFGMGMAVFQVGRQELLVNSVSEELRPRVAAFVGAVSRFGTIFAPVIGALIFDLSGGLRLVFLLQGLLAWASLWGLLSKPYENLAQISATTATHMTAYEIIKEFRQPLFTSGVFMNGLQILRESRRLIVPIVGHRLGWSVESISFLLSLSYAVDFATCFAADKLFALKGLKFASWVTASLFCLSLVSLALSALNDGFLWFGGILAGVANGSASGISLLLGSEIAKPSVGPMFYSVWRLITDTGEFLGPIVTGVLVDVLPIHAALLVIAGIGVGGAYVYAGCDVKAFAVAVWLTPVGRPVQERSYELVGKTPMMSVESSPTASIHK